MKRQASSVAAWAAVIALSTWTSFAHAAMIAASTELVDTPYHVAEMEIETTTAGRVTVQLNDLAWPERLASLSFAAVSGSSNLLGAMDGAGTMSFDIAGPMAFFARVYAAPQGDLGVGLYSMRVDFAPVPLPPALWLLGSAIAGVFGLSRKRRRVVPASARA